MGLGPRVAEKIGRREVCAADFRFDPENRVQGAAELAHFPDRIKHKQRAPCICPSSLRKYFILHISLPIDLFIDPALEDGSLGTCSGSAGPTKFPHPLHHAPIAAPACSMYAPKARIVRAKNVHRGTIYLGAQ